MNAQREQAPGLPVIRFTAEDCSRAYDLWGCNCGPSALAACCGLTLDEVRPHLGNFERKRYSNITLMRQALQSLGCRTYYWSLNGPQLFANHGLARIQWHGPWTQPGKHWFERARKTHWIATHETPGSAEPPGGDVWVFDINIAMSGQVRWIPLHDWWNNLVPLILQTCVPGNDGAWSVTHAIEVRCPQEAPR